MYWTYLRRELTGRAKQTAIVAIGLAIAVAVVIVVNSLAAGVRDAQTQALATVYGVGTDLTVSGADAEPGEGGGGPRFDFEGDEGQTSDDGTTSLSQSRLMTDFLRGTINASAIDTVASVDGVSATTAALSLTNTTFDGELPQRPDGSSGETSGGEQAPPGGADGGGGGFGGGSFDIESFSVLGVAAADVGVGPLSAVEVQSGRALDASDAGSFVAVLDATYAASSDLEVGDTLDVGGEAFEVVGVVASALAEADTASDVYIPLDVAQDLAGVGDVVSTVYVQAASSDRIGEVQAALESALPDAKVSSQSDLAETVSGSLASASSLIANLGTWLSVLVLALAIVLAVLFTLSGVSRRTREIGTLKALGWSRRRVIGQIAGESLVQSALGGVVGVLLGVVAALTVTLIAPTISAAQTATDVMPGGRGGAGFGDRGGMGAFGSASSAVSDVTLSAPLSLGIVLAALLLAVAGGLLAGAVGGWRAARLRPAEALRAVA